MISLKLLQKMKSSLSNLYTKFTFSIYYFLYNSQVSEQFFPAGKTFAKFHSYLSF